jgi:hypothetical protein
MQNKWSRDDFRRWIGIALLAALIVGWGWPVSTLLLVSIGAYRLAGKDEEIWARASRRFLLPFTYGLAALTALLCFLKVFRSIRPEWVFAFEDRAELLTRKLKAWTHLPLPLFLCILACLLLLAYLWPKSRPVTRFLKAQKLLSQTYLFLVGFTSFTIFVQAPAEEWAKEVHERRVWQYEVALQQEHKETARQAAAKTVQRALTSLSPSDRDYLRTLIKSIQERTNDADRAEVLLSLAAQHMSDALNQERVKAYVANLVQALVPDLTRELTAELAAPGRPETEGKENGAEALRQAPETVAEVNKEIAQVEEQQQRAETARERAAKAKGELKKAVDEIGVQIVGKSVPELTEPMTAFLEEMANHLTEYFEHKIEVWYRWSRRNGFATRTPDVERLVPKTDVAKEFLAPEKKVHIAEHNIPVPNREEAAKSEVAEVRKALDKDAALTGLIRKVKTRDTALPDRPRIDDWGRERLRTILDARIRAERGLEERGP